MAEYEIMGTKQPLGKRAIGTPNTNASGGTYEIMGSEVSMSRKAIHSPSANPREGKYDIMGAQIPLSRAAVKGWGNAASLVMSDTCLAQSNNVAQRKGRRR
jgi:hypothetical protein